MVVETDRGAIDWTKEQTEERERERESERHENKDPPEATFFPLAVGLTRWVDVATEKKKKKKGKKRERTGRRGQKKKGEALGLGCSGSLATVVVRSDDTYLSTGRACIRTCAHTVLRAGGCRGYAHAQRMSKYTHKRAYARPRKRGLLARREIHR